MFADANLLFKAINFEQLKPLRKILYGSQMLIRYLMQSTFEQLKPLRL